MPHDGSKPNEDRHIVNLTLEELEELRLATAARARMNGSGTRPHEVCINILRKLNESEERTARDGKEEAVAKKRKVR